MKEYTSPLIIWETKTILIYYYLTHSRMAIIKTHTQKKQKKTQIISIGKDVEKFESLCTVLGNVELCIHYGKQYGGSSKY